MHLNRFVMGMAIGASAAMASLGALAQSVSLSHAVRLDDAALGEVRGGFVSPQTGLAVSFGIDRAVYVNGDLAASTVVSTAGGAGITLVQRGVGNSIDASTLNSLVNGQTAGTVIQNSLDNQKIQTVTTISVKANSLSAWNGMNLNASVSGAISASLIR